MNRRGFLASAAATAMAASDRVNIAIIGVRGRGKALARSFWAVPGVEILYLVDVDSRVVPPVAEAAEKASGKRPKVVSDLRRALEDKSIDAVAIATPDHWHAPATILACEAGKDVYVEKPCAHNYREGRLMVDTARRTGRIVQHGTQARSRTSTIQAIEIAKSGRIGKVLMAKAWNVQKRKNIGHLPDSPVPDGVDYQTWVGPAPFLPFNENRYHYAWHWHWNFGTGDMGNDGAHQIDQARWALNEEVPVEVGGAAGKLYFDDDQITPDTMTITYKYPSGKMMIFEMRIWNPYKLEGVDNGVAVYGTEGMVQIGRWADGAGFKVFDQDGKVVLTDQESKDAGAKGEYHSQNFIDCVRSRKAPNAEIATGFQSALHCHLGNIVARTGRGFRFDPRTESIPGDAEANRLLGRDYRDHWAKPKGV